MFDVGFGASLTLSAVTVRNGIDHDGGCIRSAGGLTLINVEVADCLAKKTGANGLGARWARPWRSPESLAGSSWRRPEPWNKPPGLHIRHGHRLFSVGHHATRSSHSESKPVSGFSE